MIDRTEVYNKYDGCCAYCGKYMSSIKDMQIDHIVPKCHGGTDDIENLNPSCRRCNHYKRGNSLEVFRDMVEKIPEKLMNRQYIFKVGVDYGFFEPHRRKVQFYFESEIKEKE